MVTHTLYDSCDGLAIIYKFITVKVSVGLILIEDAVQQFLYSSGTINIDDDDEYTEEDKIQRIYCVIALAEFALLSYFLYNGFSPLMVASSNTLTLKSQVDDKAEDKSSSSRSWSQFLSDCLSIRSITCFTYLDPKNEKGALTEALISNEATEVHF